MEAVVLSGFRSSYSRGKCFSFCIVFEILKAVESCSSRTAIVHIDVFKIYFTTLTMGMMFIFALFLFSESTSSARYRKKKVNYKSKLDEAKYSHGSP